MLMVGIGMLLLRCMCGVAVLAGGRRRRFLGSDWHR